MVVWVLGCEWCGCLLVATIWVSRSNIPRPLLTLIPFDLSLQIRQKVNALKREAKKKN